MSWKDVVGHEAAVRLLKGQLASGRLSHTYLLAGREGIGKHRLALEFAKAVECEKAQAEACDACDTCRRIDKGSFPDLMRVDPESETGQIRVDQIRKLAGGVSLTPYAGRWKIGIVNEADRMTEEAAHGCLKLLEEPPAQTLLILIAAAPYRLPATLVSRCHLVRCFPQGIRRVAQTLQEAEGLDSHLAAFLATWSGGRLGVALEFHRQQRLAAKNAALDQILAAWKRKAPEVPLTSGPRRQVEEALEWTAAWWRDLLVLSLKGDPAWLIHQDRRKDLERELAGVQRSSIDYLLDRIERTYWVQEAVQRNASPRIALATLLIGR